MSVHFVPSFAEGLRYLFLNRKADQTPLDAYKTNYYRGQLQSIAVGSSSYVLAGISIGLYFAKSSKQKILLSAVSSVFMGALWHVWGNKPALLAKKVSDAIVWTSTASEKEKFEEIALNCLKNGAEICGSGRNVERSFDFLPLFAIRTYSKYGTSDFMSKATLYNFTKVLSYLVSLNVGVFDHNWALGWANTREVVEVLLKQPYTAPTGKYEDTPLDRQLSEIVSAIEQPPSYLSKDEIKAEVVARLNIIDFMLERNIGIKFPNNVEKFLKNALDLKTSEPSLADQIKRIEQKLKPLLAALKK